MDEPGFTDVSLQTSRVAIWGLGLMGGSLALALKGKCARLVGIDSNPATAALAVSREVVEQATTDPGEVLPGTDLIVLATPIHVILATIAGLPALYPGEAVVIDLGSTKAQIVEALSSLPDRFSTVGGHPMCGKEKSTLQYADPNIFNESVFALAETRNTTGKARRLAEELVRAAGSRAMWLDPAEHDRWVAATSHAPFLVASALAAAAPAEARPMVGTGFRSTTRIAASSTEMMVDILKTNRLNVLEAIRATQARLSEYEQLLEAEAYHSLAEQFQAAAEHMQSFNPHPAPERGAP